MWAPPTALLSKSMERIHARFVSHMSNDTGFEITLTECYYFQMIIQVYKILHHLILTFRICLCFLRMLLDMLVGTVIGCLFLGCGLLIDKNVCLIEGR